KLRRPLFDPSTHPQTHRAPDRPSAGDAGVVVRSRESGVRSPQVSPLKSAGCLYLVLGTQYYSVLGTIRQNGFADNDGTRAARDATRSRAAPRDPRHGRGGAP